MRRLAMTLCSIGMLSACSGGDVVAPPGPPNHIAIIGGSGQVGLVAAPLPTTLRVEVEDVNNRPIPDVAVAWAVQGPSAATITPSSRTDANGIAEASVTLGTAAGAYTAAAAASTSVLSSVIALTATADVAAKFSIATRATTGRAGQLLDQSPVVKITDRFGNPVFGATNTVRVALVAGRFADGTAQTSAVAAGPMVTFGNLRFTARGTYRLIYSVDPGLVASGASEDSVAVYAATPVAVGFINSTILMARGTTADVVFALLDTYQNESNWLDNGLTDGFFVSCPSNSKVSVFLMNQPASFRLRPTATLYADIFAPLGTYTCTAGRGSIVANFTLRVQ